MLVIGREKHSGPGVKFEKILQVCVAGAIEISNRKLSVTIADASSITAVVILKLKRRRAGNGTVISVDRRDSDC